MPRLSICIPTFNRAHHLGPTLETILTQSYSDFEVVIVDNASTDGTEDLVRHIGDRRVRYVRNLTNVGLILNQNRCIEEASAELIAVYHDHDLYHRDLVKRSIEIFDKYQSVGVVCCAVYMVDPSDPQRVISKDVQAWEELIRGRTMRRLLLHRWDSPITAPTAMVRSACYDKAGVFRPEFGGGADRELWLRILRHWDVGYIRQPMASLRDRVKEIPADPERAAAWSAEQWAQLSGQVRIQRTHLEYEFRGAPLRRTFERARLRVKAFREFWKWAALMLPKGDPEVGRLGAEAFRAAGMPVSAAVLRALRDSTAAKEGFSVARSAYQAISAGLRSASGSKA